MGNGNASTDDREYEVRARLLTLFENIFMHLSRLALRHSLLTPELERLFRWCSIQVALNDPEFAIEVAGQVKQKPPHAAVRTGLTIPEINRTLRNHRTPPVDPRGDHLHRLIRIVTAWRTEPRYQDSGGLPIDLPVRGNTPSLHQLCRKYARGVPTRPVADSLVKYGNAEWVGESEGTSTGSKLRFLKAVVTADFDAAHNVEIFTQIGSDFMDSFQKILNPAHCPRPRFRETYFNDIDIEQANEAMDGLHIAIQDFNQSCTDILKRYRAAPGKAVIRVGVGSYSFQAAPLVSSAFEER